jgi:hypothetical protein
MMSLSVGADRSSYEAPGPLSVGSLLFTVVYSLEERRKNQRQFGIRKT